MEMERKGSAVWEGDLKKGKGHLSTESGALKDFPYGFCSRFEHEKGTNPEELLAAAHAGCFTMAVSAELGKFGITPKKLHTAAKVTLESDKEGFSISKSHLELHAEIPGVERASFDKAVEIAKKGCPVSKLFRAEIRLTVYLNESADSLNASRS